MGLVGIEGFSYVNEGQFFSSFSFLEPCEDNKKHSGE